VAVPRAHVTVTASFHNHGFPDYRVSLSFIAASLAALTNPSHAGCYSFDPILSSSAFWSVTNERKALTFMRASRPIAPARNRAFHFS